MRVTRIVGSALLAAALLSGCGGAEAGVEEPAPVAEREDALLTCTRQYWTRFYSNAQHTNLVGERRCVCGSAPAFWGNIRTMYTEEVVPYEVCP
ncbi:hypothetical protein ACLESO_35040 [Pyxidicoccus sp. 3LG]